jgi:thiol-disulfide isomerase/thioredoxin
MLFKKIGILFVLIMSLAFINSCNKESKDVKVSENQNSASIPSTSKADIRVYPTISNDAASGNKAADFTWDQNGKQVKFSEFTKGKFVLLNFWGTWCPPCRRELPDLVAISKEMESKGLIVMGVALERAPSMNEALNIVSTFWDKNQLYYPVVIGTGDLASAYGGINAVPTTFLINDKGEIVNTIEGSRSKEGFMQEISKMMKN